MSDEKELPKGLTPEESWRLDQMRASRNRANERVVTLSTENSRLRAEAEGVAKAHRSLLAQLAGAQDDLLAMRAERNNFAAEMCSLSKQLQKARDGKLEAQAAAQRPRDMQHCPPETGTLQSQVNELRLTNKLLHRALDDIRGALARLHGELLSE